MRILGLIGGLSWENTIDYYRIINQMVKDQLGGWNSAEILLYSVNFEKILALQNLNRWDEIAQKMIAISKRLENAGAEALFICSNTMHKIADAISKEISIPIINVIDETAKAILKKGITRVGLLGTKFTMEGKFYTDRLERDHGLDVLLPNDQEITYIHNVIYNEFAQGKFLSETKVSILKIIDGLTSQGAQGIILGCTELPILIKQEDVKIPLFDTLKIHLEAAVNYCLIE